MNERRASPTRHIRLNVAQAHAWLAARPKALLLDAREARHHAIAHLDGSLRLDGRNHEVLLLREPRERPVFIYCYHGHASQTWAEMFVDFGFTEVADLIGGWTAFDPLGQRQGAQTLDPWPDRPAVPAELAHWLRDEGFDPARPEEAGPHGNTPLMHAAWRGARDALDRLLAIGVPLDAVNHDGNNALWLACVHGDADTIRTLAARGVPIDHANLTGATALMYAASSGKAAVVDTLLALGADPTLRTQDDFSALDMAASLECLQRLRAATRSRPEPMERAA